MSKFTTNAIYACRSIGNSECIFSYTVVKRTAKTVTVRKDDGSEKRVKVNTDDDGNELVYPEGKYSMCPVLRATKVLVA